MEMSDGYFDLTPRSKPISQETGAKGSDMKEEKVRRPKKMHKITRDNPFSAQETLIAISNLFIEFDPEESDAYGITGGWSKTAKEEGENLNMVPGETMAPRGVVINRTGKICFLFEATEYLDQPSPENSNYVMITYSDMTDMFPNTSELLSKAVREEIFEGKNWFSEFENELQTAIGSRKAIIKKMNQNIDGVILKTREADKLFQALSKENVYNKGTTGLF